LKDNEKLCKKKNSSNKMKIRTKEKIKDIFFKII